MTDTADPVEVLIGAFERWDHAAAAMPRYPTAGTLRAEAAAKEAAIKALGLDTNQFHRAVAGWRRNAPTWLPGGLTVGDAVQAALNDLGIDAASHELKEAS